MVIGGGTVAERKVKELLRCQTKVYLVSPDLTSFLLDLVGSDRIIYYERKFSKEDLLDKFLVISATGDKSLNALLQQESFEKGFLLNVADQPDKGNFLVPATVRRGRLQIAISTTGASPLLAKKIRLQLEKEFGPEYERFLDILTDTRKSIIDNVHEPDKRKEIFQAILDADIPELLRNGNEAKAKERINQCLFW